MGDRTWTSIQFSGQITTAVAEGLLDAMNEDNCIDCMQIDKELSLELLRIPRATFYHDECNYAQLETVEGYCHEHGIAYCKTWAAGGDYGPGIEVFTGYEVHSCGTLEGEPVVTRSMLTKLGTGILEYFDRFDFTSDKYPPLTIID